MPTNTYNVYRTIHSDGNNINQLIAIIKADTIDVATDRARLLKSFFSWDGKPGMVIDVNDTQPVVGDTYSASVIHLHATRPQLDAIHAIKKEMQIETARYEEIKHNLAERYHELINCS